jgi:hypothetical protein
MSTQKTYLDSAGLSALWTKIQTGFAPRWTAYKPGASTNEPATIHKINESGSSLSASETQIGINFHSAGILTDGGGTKYGTDITLLIPQATPSTNGAGGYAGLLSAADKEKIDDMSTTAETAVTLKGIHVGKGNGTALNIDSAKFAHFNFVYNETTKSLDITDRNNSDAVLATVPISHFTEDLAISSVISDANVLAELPAGATLSGGTTQNPPYLALTFILTREGVNAETGADETYTETNTIYTSLADLVSTYTASTGLEVINLAGDDLGDDVHTTAAFRLKSAATTERGGIKVVEVTTGTGDYVTGSTGDKVRHEADKNRNFGIERNSNDIAFVNVPIGNITAADEITVGDQSIDIKENARTNVAQSFTVISGLTVTKDTDDQGHSISYKTKTIEILPETPITVTKSTTNDTAEDYNETANPKHELGTFNVMSSIAQSEDKNGHAITYKTKDITLYETELTLGTSVAATAAGDKFIASAGHIVGGTTAENENVSVAGANSFTYLDDISVNDHTITKTFKTTVISTPTIPLSIINALSYPLA